MSCWNKEELENMLEDVVNELNLSESAIEKHGPMGTAPAELVRLVLDEKNRLCERSFQRQRSAAGNKTRRQIMSWAEDGGVGGSGCKKIERVSCTPESAGWGRIDDDNHEQFIELLSATRDWICERTPINDERIVQATISLNLFDPNRGIDGKLST
jgi:hypothetical protein